MSGLNQLKRNLSDLTTDPRAYLEMAADRMRNSVMGQRAVAGDRGAGMVQLTPQERRDQIQGAMLDNSGQGAMGGALGIIKNKGGNWLTGSVENALSGLKKPLRAGVEPPYAVDPKTQYLNNWIEGPLTKYIKRDMATEGDPVRKLAEQNILHYPADDLYSTFHAEHRATAGMPSEGVAKSQLARNYENITDGLTRPNSASTWRRNAKPEIKESMPWLDNLPDDEMVYELANDSATAEKLGFNHLTDELSNALNPESGLPRQLLLTPEQMQQMGMEKAVRHVADINAWRAAQKAEANAKLAQSPAVHGVREYPEGQYFRAGEGMFFNPDRAAVEEFGRNFGGNVGQYRVDAKRTGTDKDVEKVAKMLGIHQEGTPAGQYLEQGDNAVFAEAPQMIEELRNMGFDSVNVSDGISKSPSLVALDPSIIKSSTPNPKGLRWVELKREGDLADDISGEELNARTKRLADQLKYEGDTMGHCVGGYCDDVVSGKSRIYSLRDAKGEPHVTVETRQQRSYGSDHLNAQRAQAEEEAIQQGLDPDRSAYGSFVANRMDELAKQNLLNDIIQIKGKQNKKPNDEYLPFVQDFVKNHPEGGAWGDVGDFGNTGLIKHSGKRAEALGPYSTEEELTKYLDQFPDTTQGYAEGGTIREPQWEQLEGGYILR